MAMYFSDWGCLKCLDYFLLRILVALKTSAETKYLPHAKINKKSYMVVISIVGLQNMC